MQPTSEGSSDEVDQLLDELLPASGGQNGDIAQWRGVEVPAGDSLPRTIPKVPVETPVESKRRLLTGLLAALVLCVVVAGVGGYWFGSRQTVEADESPAARVEQPSVGSESASDDGTSEVVTRGTLGTADTNPPAASIGPADSDDAIGPADLAAQTAALQEQVQAIDLSPITFVTGNETLTEEGRAALAEVAALLNDHPSVPVEVLVSTYTEATPGHNHGLSTLQARSINDALMAAGVDPDRLAHAGLGGAVEQPPVGSTALRFDTDDADLAETLSGIGGASTALDADDGLTAEATATLDRVNDALNEHPTSTLTLIGYAYADSQSASHDRSHDVLDAAEAYLTGRGVDADRLSTVGLGRTPIESDRETRVELSVGPQATISVALAQIDTDRIAFTAETGGLTDESLELLDDVAAALALDPTVAIVISAHSYTGEDSQQNHDLSHLQGDAVVDALVDAGVAADRLTVVGHGDPPHFAQTGRDSYITFQPDR